MIAQTEGATSPYYAGLNLVLMGAGIVLRWTLIESIWLLVIALTMYLGACFWRWPITDGRMFFNNVYFLVVTGVFAMAGNYLYSLTRFREFELRYTVDEQKRQVDAQKLLLEENHEKLVEQKRQVDEQKLLLEENHQKLLELDQVKNRFFANISHELRTPLTLLLAPLDRLHQDLPDGEAKDLVTTMQANGMRLLKLINDLFGDAARSGQRNTSSDSSRFSIFRPPGFGDFPSGGSSSDRGRDSRDNKNQPGRAEVKRAPAPSPPAAPAGSLPR
jgi:signal transduction histidine kinase